MDSIANRLAIAKVASPIVPILFYTAQGHKLSFFQQQKSST
jgi:hypothetical protein